MNYLFDLDDTLYDHSQPFVHAYRAVFADRYALDVHRLYMRHRVYSQEAFVRNEKKEITREEMYIYRTTAAMRDFGYVITAEEALQFQQAYAELQYRLTLDETMIEILDYCKKTGQFVQVITNGPSKHQRAKINALGLDRWINTADAVISSETGYRKPDKEIFELARQHFSLDINQTFFVGDSPETDIRGAVLAGWKTIWLDRGYFEKPDDVNPDFIVHDERELLQLIRDLTDPH